MYDGRPARAGREKFEKVFSSGQSRAERGEEGEDRKREPRDRGGKNSRGEKQDKTEKKKALAEGNATRVNAATVRRVSPHMIHAWKALSALPRWMWLQRNNILTQRENGCCSLSRHWTIVDWRTGAHRKMQRKTPRKLGKLPQERNAEGPRRHCRKAA